MVVRPSAVAGQFYSGDAEYLRKQVSELLASAAMPIKNVPKALIAPHAGYVYSGATAAAAFATLRNGAQTITRVVLIGPAHYVHVRGIAAPTVDAFETPLGRVPVDASALDAIAGLPSVMWEGIDVRFGSFATEASSPQSRPMSAMSPIATKFSEAAK